MRLALLLSACLIALPATAAVETRIPDEALAVAGTLRERALADDTGWKIVESLTTEVGPRLPGSEADARAVEWAKAKFAELGYDKVWTEPVTFPKWERRGESAEVLARTQPLVVTALGGSPGGTIEAEIVRFESLGSAAGRAGRSAGRQDRLRRCPHGTHARRQRLRQGQPGARTRPVRGDPQGRHRLPDAFHRHQPEPRREHRHHPLRRWIDADPVRGAVAARCRPVEPPAAARPGARAAGAGLRLERRIHLAERDRRNHRQRTSGGSGGDRQPPRFVGPGHRRDRRCLRRRHHHGRRAPHRPVAAAPETHDPRDRLRQRGTGPDRRAPVRATACGRDRPPRDRRRERLRFRPHLRHQLRRAGARARRSADRRSWRRSASNTCRQWRAGAGSSCWRRPAARGRG